MRLAWDKFIASLHRINGGDGTSVKLERDEKLWRYQRFNWNNLLTRARIVE
jgi:hypothetical protein